MGVMRFSIDPLTPDQLGEKTLQAYVVGYDGRVMPTRTAFEDGCLTCTRPISDSGKVKIVWPVEGRGLISLSTTSLRERSEPYLITVELARGLICELRNQVSVWQIGGMSIPTVYRQAEKEAFKLFAKAACLQADDPAEAAVVGKQAIEAAVAAEDELMRSYTLQRLASPGRVGAGPSVVLGCGVSEVPDARGTELFRNAFSAVSIPLRWAHVESQEGLYDWSLADELVAWGESADLYVRGGPMLDFGEGGLPKWLGQWSHDLLSVQSFLCDFVETAIARHRGAVKFWDVATAACSGGAFGFSEEQRLTLVARVLDAAQKADDDSHAYVRVDQPWGEYQRGGGFRLSPLQFVDALARSNLGLEGVTLELNLADPNSLAATRSMSDVSRMIDQWSLLGLPLQILVTVSSDPSLGWSEAMQERWLGNYLPMLMGKPSVSGIFWAHLRDAVSYPLPGTGVIRENGTTKPSYDLFARHFRAQGRTPSGR